MSLLDIEEIESIFSRSRLWSLNRFNLISFRRSDYIGGPGISIASEVKRLIHRETGHRFDGRILLLTHLRYLGFCFNPVSFYFCYQGSEDRPRFILAEINNTPWNERFCYVLDNAEPGDTADFVFAKNFHVSPFMPMNLEYSWRFVLCPDKIRISMVLLKHDKVCFEARLKLAAQALTADSMRRVPLKYPFITLSVVFRIYWQAFRLFLKQVPVHNHTKHTVEELDYEHHR